MHGLSGSAVVRAYLEAMEARDLARAGAMLAPGFWMQFPGTGRMTRIEDLIAWAKPRYQRCAKRYERFDEVAAGEETIVYCFGALYGIGNDGEPFDGIRFIDRFTVRDSKLVDQRVWNDLAEVMAGRRRP
jgi:hypothetical protein